MANLSFDLAVRHCGSMPAARHNSVELPTRTLIDAGARHRFAIGRAPATLRVSLANATNQYGYDLRSSGAYDVISGRRASAYLAVDWIAR